MLNVSEKWRYPTNHKTIRNSDDKLLYEKTLEAEADTHSTARSPYEAVDSQYHHKFYSLKILIDSFTFKWVTYLDNDADIDCNKKDQYTNLYVNVGLLAALIFTVIFVFFCLII